MKYLFLLLAFAVPALSCSDADEDEPEPTPEPVIEPEPYPDICNYLDYSAYTSAPAVNMVANLPLTQELHDMWLYTEENSGKEYVLAGFGYPGEYESNTGFYIIDVSNPESPVLVDSVEDVQGWDIKTFGHYAYSVSGEPEIEGKIVDLSDISNPVVKGQFPGAHNVFITCNGLLVLSDPGIRIYDLNKDPENPSFVWGDGRDGGHESAMFSNILYDFHGFSGTYMYDMTNPEDPELIGVVSDSRIRFHHSGWVNEDETILIIQDERPGGGAANGEDFTIWDISEKGRPKFLSSYRDLDATIHNVHMINDIAYFSYYAAGYRVFDVSVPESPQLIYEYKTDPKQTGKGNFQGSFGIYALSPTGYVYISDVHNGLFVFGPQ